MSKYRLQRDSIGFAVINEHRDHRAGHISVEYRVRTDRDDEIAVVGSMEEAFATLDAHLSASSPPWEDGGGGAGRYVKLLPEYGDFLVVEQNQEDGGWRASRNDWPLGDGNGPVTFSTASKAQRAADLHAGDGHPKSKNPSDGLSWLIPSDAEEEDEQRYRIEHQLGQLIAEAAEAMSRARTEHDSGGIRPETAQTLKAEIRRLCAIRDASLFGSYDTERRSNDPYFVLIENGEKPAAPARVSFHDAAYHYGQVALRDRIGPDVTNTVCRDMISQVLARMPGKVPRAWC